MDEKSGILYRRWGSPDPKAVLLLVHGLGAHSERWDAMSSFLAERGIASYAVELTGFGETVTLKGHADSLDVYFKEIAALRAVIAEEHHGKKVYLAGESLGALIAFFVAAKEPRSFDGLIAISPAFGSALKFRFADYARMLFALIFMPKRYFKVPFSSSMCTRDEKEREHMENDPREHRSATARLLCNIAIGQMRAPLLSKYIRMPSLFLAAGEERMVDPAATRYIFGLLGSGDKELREYPGMFHALTIDLGKERVFEDIAVWVKARA